MQMPDIDRRRRFVFRGNASAFGGRIVRPDDLILESNIASSLTVAGGRSRNAGKDITFARGDRRYVQIDSAETFAEGVYDDVKQHEALTFRRVTADALSTTTKVSASVTGLKVGLNPVLEISHLKAGIIARSPATSGEPAIRIEVASFGDITIGGEPLIVTSKPEIFQEHDTCSKLLAALDNPSKRADLEPFMLLKSDLHGLDPAIMPSFGRLFRSQGTIYATVVESITWRGETRMGHTLRVPNFGKIVLGELLITDLSRRFTMVRLELGSPEGGDAAFAEVESNGIWP